MKIFVNEPIHPAAMELLRSRAEVVSEWEDVPAVSAALVRTTKIGPDFLNRVKQLRVIGKHGIGYDNIDIASAKERGIAVVYTPLANVNSVAELAVSLFLALARKLVSAQKLIRSGECTRIAPPELTGTELSGKTVALIGLGHIAQQVAQILGVGFHCHLVGYDPYVSREKMATLDIEKADCLKEALRAGDLINISVPLNDSTRGMIGSAELGVCRPTAILVNTARGGIVDEVALYEALSRNELAAAASDVFAVEPPGVDMPLMSLPNFLPTPHIGANTEEALYRMGITVVEDLFAVLNGVSPRFPVP